MAPKKRQNPNDILRGDKKARPKEDSSEEEAMSEEGGRDSEGSEGESARVVESKLAFRGSGSSGRVQVPG